MSSLVSGSCLVWTSEVIALSDAPAFGFLVVALPKVCPATWYFISPLGFTGSCPSFQKKCQSNGVGINMEHKF